MASKFDVMEVQQLQYQIDIVEENLQHLVAAHNKGRKPGSRDEKDDTAMRTYYEKNYKTLLSLCAQYERKIRLLEAINQKRMHLETDEGQQSGIRVGMLYGGMLSVALFVPLTLFVF